MELAPGAVVGGKYRIERALARGGMGSLWVARHAQLGSTVALKFLDPSFAASPAHRARFEREARAAATLKSPHVVQVHDYGFEGAAPYIVMELLEGEDLGQRLHRVRRMSLHDTAKILVQVGKALRKAHEAGFAHRDLKPANLFLARVDDEEVVKVLDFGIAKEQHAALGDATRTGEVIGSPHYMSPEQVRAEKDADHRSDLWSLGIILYRMLVGVLPFPGDQLGPVLAKILTDPIPVPTRAAPDLPHTMDGFFARALARDKQQRFQSIGEMIEAFHAAAGGREALPSISMSIGTGPLQAPGGTAVWSPPSAATLTGSALVTASSPVTTGGLASTGSAPKPNGAGVVIAIGALTVAAVAAAAVAFFVLRSPSEGPVTGASAGPTAVAAPPEPTAVPSVDPVPSASAPVSTAEPSSTAPVSASSSAAAKSPTPAKPKATTRPKEKWF